MLEENDYLVDLVSITNFSDDENDFVGSSEDLSKLLSGTSSELNFENISLSLLREASIIQAKEAIQDSLTPDKNLIQAIETLDEAHSNLNISSERFITWYSQLTGNPRIKLDSLLDRKELPSQLIPLRDSILTVKKLIAEMSSYLDNESPRVISNLVEILGTQLAARIVSLAGGLSKLARMPASTIQLLGAEKALFRHIADGSPPPKHGVLYQHPNVKKASGKEKGKVSRKLAAKVAIASRIDFFGENNG